MAKIHFRSMETPQNKSEITNRFGDRKFVLAVCTYFLRNSDRRAVIPVNGSIAEKSDITIQFLVGDLVIHFAGSFHVSYSVQKLFKNFMLVQWLNFFQFLGANMTLNISLQPSTPLKDTSLRICASIDVLWLRWLFPFGLYGVGPEE
jgi:hypothetical protein